MVLTPLCTVCTNYSLQYAGSIYGLGFLNCTLGMVLALLHESKRRATGVNELRWGQGSTEWLIWPSTTGCGPQQDWVLLTIITACALISGHGLTYACVHFCIWLDYWMPISPRRSPGVSPLAEFTQPVKQGHVISTLWLVSYFYFSCIFTVLWISLTPVLKYPWQLWPDSNLTNMSFRAHKPHCTLIFPDFVQWLLRICYCSSITFAQWIWDHKTYIHIFLYFIYIYDKYRKK